ncbi:MAG: hypothetical protein KAV82_16725, partial [Phycisphaerae bacterium]|nr:hypothetical protein [Phycisphaerae bacterium]
LTPPPDLEISYLSVSESALAGSSVVVDWMVTNYGGSTTYGHSQNPTVVHRWTDAIYLSADDSFETTGNNVLLGRIESDYFESGLAPDESYSQSRSVTLPTCIDGPYYLFVVTDVDDKVEEYFAAYEANNDDVFEAMFVSTEAPDLQISNVAGPGVGSSGQQVTVSWEVANIGIGATGSGSFVDRVYLSADQALDTFEDMLLGSFTHADVVEPVDGYTETREVTLPPGMSGSYFIFALTNAAGDVDECGATGNNADYDAAGIFIAFTEADLMVSNVTVPSLGLSGQPISVDWTVVNAGNRATDATFWSDAVYLSSDGTLNTDHDTLLGTFAHTGALDSAESYDRSGSVTLPVGISGTYYVFVCADENDNVLEPEQENNNCTAAVPMSVVSTEPDLMVTTVTGPISGSSGDPILVEWTVENSGERATDQSSWRDAIYLSTDTELNKQNDVLLGSLTHSGALGAGEGYTASRTVTLSAGGTGSHYILVETDNAEVVYEAGREENNVGYDPAGIEVSCIEADLIVTDVSGPAMGDAGWPIQVGWTVSNVGDRATSTSSWIDAVYLSDDPDFNAGDTLLGEFSRNTVLGVGGLYTRTAQVSLPGGVSGVHYLFVVTDVEDDVEECADEGNNASTSPSAITIAATEVDLQVLSVNGPEQAYAGQDVTVNWSVINAGASTTPSGSWRDSVYLSLDLFVDPGSDPFLGFVVHENPLGSQVTYNRNKTFTIPASTLSDDYYVLVLADSTDEVFEYEAEGNNLGYSEDTIAVGEPLQADLVVTDIVVPLTASPGQQATFVWTVTNQGANAALGSWYDSVYLSVDETWDLGDALVAKVKHTGTVAADGGSYTASKTALVPGVVPVPQYVIVRCDINGQIPEGEEGEDNNIGMSTDTVDVQIIELELGVSFDS